MLALLAKMQQPIKKLPSQQSANQVPVNLELEGERSLGEVLIGQSERTKHTSRMGIPYARELIAPSGTNEDDFVSPGNSTNILDNIVCVCVCVCVCVHVHIQPHPYPHTHTYIYEYLAFIRIFQNLYLLIMFTCDRQIKNSCELLHIGTIMIPHYPRRTD